jgi:predicted nicotinamide N-methyase
MPFTFNFFDTEDKTEPLENHDTSWKKEDNAIKSANETAVFPYDPSSLNLLFLHWKELNVGSPVHTFHYLKDIDKSSMKEVVLESDLVPDVYEGGFEVWECTVDLLNYLRNNSNVIKNGSSVLDLGCGSGLLGICAKQACCDSTVHFQDYNAEVIQNFTIKNYHKNCGNHVSHHVMFFAGDWSDVSERFSKYDIILSAETIYNVESQKKVLKILVDHLTVDGIAYIASKRHYFGVGGGVIDFQNLVKVSGLLNCEVVWSCETGLLRDILKISRLS